MSTDLGAVDSFARGHILEVGANVLVLGDAVRREFSVAPCTGNAAVLTLGEEPHRARSRPRLGAARLGHAAAAGHAAALRIWRDATTEGLALSEMGTELGVWKLSFATRARHTDFSLLTNALRQMDI